MLVGAALNLLAIGIAFAGWPWRISGGRWCCWDRLELLYIGGTTLLTETYRPEERAKAQGTNDQAIFIMMAISSFSSGMTVTTPAGSG